MLLNEVDSMKLDNFPRITRRRRDSNAKVMLDLEDMFTAVTFLDENHQLSNLVTFIANNPDKLPSTRLMEGDLEVVWTKLTTLEDRISDILNNNNHSLNIVKNNSEILLRLEQDIRQLNSGLTLERGNAANEDNQCACIECRFLRIQRLVINLYSRLMQLYRLPYTITM